MKKYATVLTPDVSRIYTYDTPDIRNMGGPVYVQIGEKIPIKAINHDSGSSAYRSAMDD